MVVDFTLLHVCDISWRTRYFFSHIVGKCEIFTFFFMKWLPMLPSHNFKNFLWIPPKCVFWCHWWMLKYFFKPIRDFGPFISCDVTIFWILLYPQNILLPTTGSLHILMSFWWSGGENIFTKKVELLARIKKVQFKSNLKPIEGICLLFLNVTFKKHPLLWF